MIVIFSLTKMFIIKKTITLNLEPKVPEKKLINYPKQKKINDYYHCKYIVNTIDTVKT